MAVSGRQVAVRQERSLDQKLPPHPDAPRTSLRRWALSQRRPLAIDLFCGCGGLSLGLERAGYTVVVSVDNDEKCLQSHQHNFPGKALNLDLSVPERINALVCLLEGIPIDLVAGGPPCQPFSRAGRAKMRALVDQGVRPERDERTELWRAFVEVVERVRPAAVLMENVPDMALGQDLTLVRVIGAKLEQAGYDVDARLVEASKYGVPQFRERLILIGARDGRRLSWPNGHRRRVTLRDAIGDLPKLGNGTGSIEMRALSPRTPFQRRAREGLNGSRLLWDHTGRPVRADDREAFRLLRPGMRYSELPERLRRYRSDIFDDKYNRLSWSDLSRSITAHIAKDGYWYIHPSELRTLTVREAARIQTFPDRFRFAGTRSHAFRQIGNAVPPALGEVIALELLKSATSRTAFPERLAAKRRRIREMLLKWGADDARTAPWRHPGDKWRALAGVVLADRFGALDNAVACGYARMASAADAIAVGHRVWESGGLPKAAKLGPQEDQLFRAIALGEDAVVPTIAALRVVARLTGTRVNEERKRSDGRMVIAQILGAQDQGPSVMAALHAFGRSICASTEPQCRSCPLRQDCAFGRQRRGFDGKQT